MEARCGVGSTHADVLGVKSEGRENGNYTKNTKACAPEVLMQ